MATTRAAGYSERDLEYIKKQDKNFFRTMMPEVGIEVLKMEGDPKTNTDPILGTEDIDTQKEFYRRVDIPAVTDMEKIQDFLDDNDFGSYEHSLSAVFSNAILEFDLPISYTDPYKDHKNLVDAKVFFDRRRFVIKNTHPVDKFGATEYFLHTLAEMVPYKQEAEV